LDDKNTTVTIIGIGRLGGALAIALSRKGYQIENLFVRNGDNAKSAAKLMPKSPEILSEENYSKIESNIVLISTQDSEIKSVSEKLSDQLSNQTVLLHTSGSLSSSVLKKSNRISTGSIHPLVSISDSIIGSEKFSGAFFGVEGEESAISSARQIAQDLGGKPFPINSESKALYHASAVMACGHLVALIDAACEMLSKCGVDESQDVLMPLVKSTIFNLENQNTSDALTGTFARLDKETFERHLKAMDGNVSNEIIELFLQLGLRSLHLVKATESNNEKRDEMLEKISLAKRNLKC
jgi:predicted short-subunit dehydrogenase-like oxidoreductase (DUF2520 family)